MGRPGDAGWIAAERRDVALRPLQGCELVERAEVGDAVAEEQEGPRRTAGSR